MDNLILYTADGCIFCDEAKTLLAGNAISFEERNVTHNEDYLRESKRLGNRWLPIIKWGETVLVSPNQDKLLEFIREYKQA